MDASLRWINALLDRPVECEEAADLLTRAGFPVEHTEAVTTRMGEDIRLDVETTSNRGDCNAHLGLAREVVALTDRQLKDPTQLAPADPVDSSEAGVSVENKAPEDCLVYHARIVRGVKVGPSPDWLAAHLEARGDVPRNNIVDATNYVLHELGHPVHAFDLDKLEGGEINIRYAQTGETMLPLGAGAQEIELSDEDLVIADAAKPIALAGVKGGAASSVDENTTNLLLETATFTPS
ncbi:MAG: phenylalanine--tRNA ligase beta subunit-related protein, partial [Planctomycetota bacterium]|nr:phenylalanine--tRNA ligase beta subunit-related protein [Planctomycetota bacterium]